MIVLLWLMFSLLYGVVVRIQIEHFRWRILATLVLWLQAGLLLSTVAGWINFEAAMQAGAAALGWWGLCVMILSIFLWKAARKEFDIIHRNAAYQITTVDTLKSTSAIIQSVREFINHSQKTLEHIESIRKRFLFLITLWIAGYILAGFGVWINRYIGKN